MTDCFQVKVLGFTVLDEIQGSWTEQDLRALLDLMEFGDTAQLAGDEVCEMCVLALQDLEPAEAAELLLQQRLGDALNKGQIQNIAHRMPEEKLWEEYTDMALHERFFHVGSLLHQAFPRSVPVPDAVDVQLEISAVGGEEKRLLAAPLHESLLVRILADGMPDTAPLHRSFGDAVRGEAFPEAESIVWIESDEALEGGGLQVRVIGSGYWLDSLRETRSFSSTARPDASRR